MIDVGALGPYALEPGAYSERVRLYTARVAAAVPTPRTQPRLLADVPNGERAQLLARPPLPNIDKDLVSLFSLSHYYKCECEFVCKFTLSRLN